MTAMVPTRGDTVQSARRATDVIAAGLRARLAAAGTTRLGR